MECRGVINKEAIELFPYFGDTDNVHAFHLTPTASIVATSIQKGATHTQ